MNLSIIKPQKKPPKFRGASALNDVEVYPSGGGAALLVSSVPGSGGGVVPVSSSVSPSSPQPIMNVEREATANAVATYLVYFFSIFVFGFSLTGSINRPRRRSD